MVVRIRWKQPNLRGKFGARPWGWKPAAISPEMPEHVALLLAALLVPSALLAFTMAFWSIASDLHWTGDFFLTSGLFSHWQIWLLTAAVLLLLSRLLDRYARE